MIEVKDYRMKPVVKEAVCLVDHTLAFDIIGWVKSLGGNADMGWESIDEEGIPTGFRLIILTDHGNMIAGVGDWIVRGVEGEFYPVQDSKFQATYEEVE